MSRRSSIKQLPSASALLTPRHDLFQWKFLQIIIVMQNVCWYNKHLEIKTITLKISLGHKQSNKIYLKSSSTINLSFKVMVFAELHILFFKDFKVSRKLFILVLLLNVSTKYCKMSLDLSNALLISNVYSYVISTSYLESPDFCFLWSTVGLFNLGWQRYFCIQDRTILFPFLKRFLALQFLTSVSRFSLSNVAMLYFYFLYTTIEY